MVFSPLQGRHFAPIKVKFGTEKHTLGPLSRAKFHVYWYRNVEIRPQDRQNFQILPTSSSLRGDPFAHLAYYEILSVCTRL